MSNLIDHDDGDPYRELAREYQDTIRGACKLLGTYSAMLGNGEPVDPAQIVAELRAALGSAA
jgi:hypothetical protein